MQVYIHMNSGQKLYTFCKDEERTKNFIRQNLNIYIFIRTKKIFQSNNNIISVHEKRQRNIKIKIQKIKKKENNINLQFIKIEDQS